MSIPQNTIRCGILGRLHRRWPMRTEWRRLFIMMGVVMVYVGLTAGSQSAEYMATSPAFNVPTNNFAMRFDTGVIQPGSVVELEFTVTTNTSDDNRDHIYCGNDLLVGLGNAYPVYSTNLPQTVTYDVSSRVAGRNLTTEDVIVSTNAWNFPNRVNFVYGSLTFSNIVLRVTPPSYTVNYHANNADSGTVPIDVNSPYLQGAIVTVLKNTGNLTKTGYTFSGWNTQANGGGITYQAENTFTMGTANVTLYALWTDDIPPVSALEPRAKLTHVGAAINLPFNASDAGSGVNSTSLWVKTPGTGAFADTGITQPDTSGAFYYTFATGNGFYEFATKAIDNAANSEHDPIATDVTVLVNTVENGSFTWTLAASDAETTYPMTSVLDMGISITGATPGGTITLSRTVGNVAPTGMDAAQLLDEYLIISGNALGDGWTATLTWNFDPSSANTPGFTGSLDSVFQFKIGALSRTFSVIPSGSTLTVNGIKDFSDWFAGNSAETRVTDWKLMK